MDREAGSRVNLLKPLQSLRLGLVAVFETARPLVEDSKEVAQGPVADEFDGWVKHVRHHSACDEHANVVEPEGVQIGVNAAKVILDEPKVGLTTVPWRRQVDKTVIKQVHAEDGHHDPGSLRGQVLEADLRGEPNKHDSNDVRVDDHDLRVDHANDGEERPAAQGAGIVSFAKWICCRICRAVYFLKVPGLRDRGQVASRLLVQVFTVAGAGTRVRHPCIYLKAPR